LFLADFIRWISEKFDGFRAMWIFERSCFVTRGGLSILPPKFIANQLPNINLDGEIWYEIRCSFMTVVRIDRGRGDEVRALVHGSVVRGPEDWKNVKFMIFDCIPSRESHNEPFESRIARAREQVEAHRQRCSQINNVAIVEIQKCTGFDHLYSLLATVLDKVWFSA
jgi:ATP-dependent DNA ligase